MESAEKHDAQLVQGVEGATQPESQKPIPLTNDLKQVGVDVTHIAGGTFDELMNGEGRGTWDRVVTEQKPISLWEKAKRLKDSLKKAA